MFQGRLGTLIIFGALFMSGCLPLGGSLTSPDSDKGKTVPKATCQSKSTSKGPDSFRELVKSAVKCKEGTTCKYIECQISRGETSKKEFGDCFAIVPELMSKANKSSESASENNNIVRFSVRGVDEKGRRQEENLETCEISYSKPAPPTVCPETSVTLEKKFLDELPVCNGAKCFCKISGSNSKPILCKDFGNPFLINASAKVGNSIPISVTKENGPESICNVKLAEVGITKYPSIPVEWGQTFSVQPVDPQKYPNPTCYYLGSEGKSVLCSQIFGKPEYPKKEFFKNEVLSFTIVARNAQGTQEWHQPIIMTPPKFSCPTESIEINGQDQFVNFCRNAANPVACDEYYSCSENSKCSDFKLKYLSLGTKIEDRDLLVNVKSCVINRTIPELGCSDFVVGGTDKNLPLNFCNKGGSCENYLCSLDNFKTSQSCSQPLANPFLAAIGKTISPKLSVMPRGGSKFRQCGISMSKPSVSCQDLGSASNRYVGDIVPERRLSENSICMEATGAPCENSKPQCRLQIGPSKYTPWSDDCSIRYDKYSNPNYGAQDSSKTIDLNKYLTGSLPFQVRYVDSKTSQTEIGASDPENLCHAYLGGRLAKLKVKFTDLKPRPSYLMTRRVAGQPIEVIDVGVGSRVLVEIRDDDRLRQIGADKMKICYFKEFMDFKPENCQEPEVFDYPVNNSDDLIATAFRSEQGLTSVAVPAKKLKRLGSRLQIEFTRGNYIVGQVNLTYRFTNSVRQEVIGDGYSCFLSKGKLENEVKCRGSNMFGQLGRGSIVKAKRGSVKYDNGTNPPNIVSLSVSGYSVCGLADNGQVWCWGYNDYGQVDPSSTEKLVLVPSLVKGADNLPIEDIQMLSVARNRTCAIRDDGQVLCWGQRSFTSDDENITPSDWRSINSQPSEVNDLAGVTSLATGNGSVCGITTDGRIICTGEQSHGNLGRTRREEVVMPSGQDIERVFGMPNYVLLSSYFEFRDKTLKDDPFATKGEMVENVHLLVSAGDGSGMCAVSLTGGVFCWGQNLDGKLSVVAPMYPPIEGQQKERCSFNLGKVGCLALKYWPQAIPAVGTTIDGKWYVNHDRVDQIAAGRSHLCVRKEMQGVKAVNCWGENRSLQSGVETKARNYSFLTNTLESAVDTDPEVVVAGGDSSAALTDDGNVVWGENSEGQLGVESKSAFILPTLDPEPIDEIENADKVIQISVGSFSSCALFGSGELKCWGRLGDLANWDEPKKIPGRYKDVSSGVGRTCAIQFDGAVVCWGSDAEANNGKENVYRYCGVDLTEVVVCSSDRSTSNLNNHFNLYRISLPERSIKVKTGGLFSCAQFESGNLSCWGAKVEYNFGGNRKINFEPQEPGLLALKLNSKIKSFEVGDRSACALYENGKLYCWGDDSNGLVTLRTFNKGWIDPQQMNLSQSVESFTISMLSICFKGDSDPNASICWDSNSAVFQTERFAYTITSLSAGRMHTCTLLSGGSVECWGRGVEGQLGDGTMKANSHSKVSRIKDLIAVSSSSDSNCALDKKGDVWCWGSNVFGQLGTGDTVSRLKPTKVKNLYDR